MIDSFKKAILDALGKRASLDEIAATLHQHRDLGVTRRMATEAVEELRKQVDAQTEDALLEVMDIIAGYCQPRYRVWDAD